MSPDVLIQKIEDYVSCHKPSQTRDLLIDAVALIKYMKAEIKR
jgi:hypothetical protein